jgi:tetratricopeptide (TPR) repeat protein
MVAVTTIGAGSARAIDNGILLALYGEGMKAYYGGDYRLAHDTFTQAIEAGSKDPRTYYFRGLSEMRLGREPDAKLDFTKGAELEALDFDVFFNVSGALQRVQGADRLTLEKYRAEGRKLARKEIERIRFQHYQRMADAATAARGPATTGADPSQPGASSAAPTTPSPTAPADNPFGTPPAAPAANPFGAPAPAPGAAPAPAANPFGNN